MEVAGLGASIVAFAQAAGSIAKVIRNIRNAPDELIALSNEVADLNLIVSDLEQLALEGNLVGASTQTLAMLLIQARAKMDELDAFIGNLLSADASLKAETASHRLRWALGKKRKANELLRQLRELRHNIAMVLGLRTAEGLSSMQVTLDKITLSQNGIGSLSTDEIDLDVISAATPILSQSTHPDDASYLRENMGGSPGQLAIRLLNQVAQHASYFGSVAEDMERLKDLQGTWYEAAPQNVYSEKLGASHIEDITDIADSSVAITVHRVRRTRCARDCKCACHLTTNIETPKFLKSLVGRLLLGYSGSLTNSSPSCTDDTCQNATPFHGRITYTFPRWFLARALTITAWRYRSSDLHFVVGVRRYAPNDDLFQQIFVGDLPQFRRLLFEQRVNPNFVERGRGETALHRSYGAISDDQASKLALTWAIDRVQPEMCKMLLQAGADPYIENDDGRAAVHHIWTFLLADHFNMSRQDRNSMKEIFQEFSSPDDLDLPRIHKLVLGLEFGNLEKELRNPFVDINERDRLGFTATIWAAQTNNNSALRLLLQYRADPDIRDHGLYTALDRAVCTSDPSTAQILLWSRANVAADPEHGFTALHHAAYHHNDISFVKSLVEAGCRIDDKEKEPYGQSSLARSAWHDRDLVAKYFIEAGADINSIDKNGDSVLFIAVRSGSVKVLRLLLAHRANYKTVNKRGYNIIHVAATYGSCTSETIEILTQEVMKGIDPEAKQGDGLTATQIFGARDDTSQELRAAFDRLLQSIKD